ncbi:MAG: hypothetical protein J5821_01555 [Alphaproteobacteria bacterium]|nr:hypothetical protein [Alphaproteobacteria bacterium]
MSGSLKIMLIFLTGSLFFSENTGKAFLYSCCLSNDFDHKESLLTLSVVSVIFDIYHSLFIGISLISMLIAAITVKKFESVLRNLPIWARLYYLLMIVCGAESVNFVLTILLEGKFNFYAHAVIILKSIFFCYVLESLKEHVKG